MSDLSAEAVQAAEPPVFSDREPVPSGLIPGERIAVTVARNQIERGENPPISITTVLLMAIDRLLEARPLIAADERERIRGLLPYHVPCCDNFYASVADLVNEHGDSR